MKDSVNPEHQILLDESWKKLQFYLYCFLYGFSDPKSPQVGFSETNHTALKLLSLGAIIGQWNLIFSAISTSTFTFMPYQVADLIRNYTQLDSVADAIDCTPNPIKYINAVIIFALLLDSFIPQLT